MKAPHQPQLAASSSPPTEEGSSDTGDRRRRPGEKVKQVEASHEEEVPKSKFVALLAVLVNEAISVTILYPYVGLLVVHVDPSMSRRDAGTVSGLIVGSFQIAQALFAQRWGRQSDVYGRRPMIALGLMGSVVFSLCFGLASSVWELLLFRFLYGAANGNAPLSKTMTAELTTPKTDAFGWAMMGAGWAVGSTIGPMLGGFLYDPAHSLSPGLFGGTIFESKPALLPSIAAALYSVFAYCVTVFVLQESNKRAKPRQWMVRLLLGRDGGVAAAPPPTAAATGLGVGGDDGDDDELAPIVMATSAVVSDDDAEEHASRGAAPGAGNADGSSAAAATTSPPASFGMRDMVHDSKMFRVLSIYVMLAWTTTTFNEVFPLLAIAPVRQGGLGVEAAAVGSMFTIFALTNFTSTAVFPRIVDSIIGRACLLQWSLLTIAASIAAHAVLPAFDWQGNTAAIVAAACVVSFPRVWAAQFAFSVSTMGIAAAAPREHLGAATGISHSCGNVARAAFPPLFTWLFAWSLRHADSGGASSTPGGDDLDGNVTNPPGATGNASATFFLGSSTATLAPHNASASSPAIDETPQGLLGPSFPLNRWFVFLLLSAMLTFTALVFLSGAVDRHFKRATANTIDDDDAAGEEDDEEKPPPEAEADDTEKYDAADNKDTR